MSRRPTTYAPSPDVIVVGAGPAGAVVARRLAEAGADVLVLEAGPDTRDLRRLPALTLPLHAEDPRARPIDARVPSGDPLGLWRGRGPGGSGAINGAAWTPAPREVIETWTGFDPRRYDDGLARAEAVMAPAEVSASPLAEELANTLGIPLQPGRLTIETGGERRDPWTAYAPEPAGARLRCDARVRELILSPATPDGPHSSTSVGGVVLDDGERLGSPAVVLAAGAIDTAHLLLGAADNAATMMDPAHNAALRSVGADAREHPEVLLDVPAPLHAMLSASPQGILGARIPLAIGGRRLEIRPYETAFHKAIPGLPKMAPQIGIALLDPRSASTVDAAVRLEARPDASDRQALDAGAELVSGALSTLAGGRGRPAGEEVRRHTGYSQHLYGTAAMGTVTDAGGRIEGLGGLRVADASILPPGLGAGPYASVFAVAEAVSESIASDMRDGLAR